MANAVAPPQSMPGARSLFTLDPNMRYLNHGSVGAVPLPVRRARERITDELEADPRGFFKMRVERVTAARQSLCEFLGLNPMRTALVRNTTLGVAQVLAALDLAPGDEIVAAKVDDTAWRLTSMSDRVQVRKTYKLFLGGKFPRSESGRTYQVTASDGSLLANAAKASRKDARDAVAAARAAQPGWAGATPYLRGQILYRMAEMVEGRAAQFTQEVRQSIGSTVKAAGAQVSATVDRLVWYAGWADKLPQVLGGANPVAGPYFNHSTPEPTGVAAIIAPQDEPLLGLVSVLAPAIVTGNCAVVLAAQSRPLPALTFAEALATSDLPGGVVNVLSGNVDEVAPWLAAHQDVNVLDLCGITDPELAQRCEESAAANLKRVRRPANPDWAADPGTAALRDFVEIKTVWHPAGI